MVPVTVPDNLAPVCLHCAGQFRQDGYSFSWIVSEVTEMAATSNLRREALQLYREVVRTSKFFAGQLDANGKDYAVLLSASARKEFEDARSLTSREEISRRIVVGRDALHQVHEKVG